MILRLGRGCGACYAALLATSLAATAEDIRDIRGPRLIVPVWLVIAIVASALGLALAVYAVLRWIRRRRRPREQLPGELALARLEAIRPLLLPERAREYSIEVSDIVRRYIEQTFDIVATHRTTEEFLHDLVASTNAPLLRHRSLLAEFLQQCDLVKFAGMSLTLENLQSLHESARAFVIDASKAAEPTAVAGKAAAGQA
ncbi:MAG: hypothetical protein NVSMB10_12150 [Steroidobacteraceae bacterium]